MNLTEDSLHLTALSSIPDLGPVTIRKLIAHFGSPEAVFNASLKELRGVDKVGSKRAEAIKGFSGLEELQRRISELGEKGIRLVTFYSEDYPELLKEISDAPLALYVKGEITKDDRFAMAIVGSRKATHYGTQVAENIASELASMGFTIVSGLARGIDTAAHIGAVRCGGRSAAVLGSGISVPYPPENKGLMERIAKAGFVMSEFPPDTGPSRENFPRRNRIISGLSMGVLVVEAAGDSGALITANHALEQGREVFSIPGNINSAVSAGTNELIKKGARVVVSAKDIIEELAPALKGFIKSREKVKIKVLGEEKSLCDILSGEPAHVDYILRQSGMPASKTLAVLLDLELKGVVKQAEGKRFYLA